jgi:tetratricopeptide (TPR) repeat protein
MDIKAVPPEFPASEAAAAKVAFRELADNHLIVRAPKDYIPNAQEYQVRLARTPISADEFADRGDARIWAGDYAKAMADFDKAVQLKPDDAPMLNGRCFARAEAGKELDRALADCNASLALDPHIAATLDSRGFVYFRMGQVDKALMDDNAALKIAPKLAPTLYVRGLIERRKGDATAGDADVAAAKVIEPTIVATYARYGVEH